VAAAGHRHALAQVAGDDLARRAVDLRETALRAEADQESAEQRQAHREAEPPDRRAAEHLVDLLELAHVTADEQPEARTDAEHERAHGRVAAVAFRLEENDPFAAAIEPLGPARDVPCDRPKRGIDEEINRAPLRVAAHALGDHVGETDDAAPLDLLREPADLGLDDLLGLPLEIAEGRPVDEREEREHGSAEQRHVDERELEDRRAEERGQAHASSRYAVASSR